MSKTLIKSVRANVKAAKKNAKMLKCNAAYARLAAAQLSRERLLDAGGSARSVDKLLKSARSAVDACHRKAFSR